jgi:hypothetical protein
MWLLISREEHKLQLSKHKVIAKIFGPKKDEGYLEIRILYNENIEEYHIPEDDTLQNHRCENLKSYNENVRYRLCKLLFYQRYIETCIL